MKRTAFKVLMFGSVIVVIGVIIGLKMFFQKPATSVEGEKVQYEVIVNDLLSEFESSEAQANEKYLDKIIQVVGIVESVDKQGSEVLVYLKNPESVAGIMCSFDESSITDDDIQKGETVNIKGICTGYLLDVVLKKCSIVAD